MTPEEHIQAAERALELTYPLSDAPDHWGKNLEVAATHLRTAEIQITLDRAHKQEARTDRIMELLPQLMRTVQRNLGEGEADEGLLEPARYADATGEGVGCFLISRTHDPNGGLLIPVTTVHRLTLELARAVAREHAFRVHRPMHIGGIPACSCQVEEELANIVPIETVRP